MRRNQFNRRSLAIEDGNVFLLGAGFSDKGQFPFIDALNIDSLTKKRVYQSKLH